MSQPLFLSEADVARLLTPQDVRPAVEAALIAGADGSGRVFPVIREQLGNGAIFGVKSAMAATRGWLGLKAGGYFPANAARGLTNHQSATLLFDPDQGILKAVVAGNRITALRTAAAAAIAADTLARSTARTLAVIGAGGQAEPHLRAMLPVRPFDEVRIWSRTHSRAEALAERVTDVCRPVVRATAAAAVEGADVIVTILSAFAPAFPAAAVACGAHISAMGTDTVGKQELDPTLLATARLFADDVVQSATIGECQHLPSADGNAVQPVVAIGSVLTGAAPGRQQAEEVTIYDGTGTALQDLALAKLAVERAQL